MLMLMLMLKLGENGAIETNVFLSSVDARVNADAWCDWALIDTKVSLSLRSFSLLSLTIIPRGVLPLLPSYVPPKIVHNKKAFQ